MNAEHNYFEVYVPPQKAHEYTIGADVAEGLLHGDYSCAYVFDRHTKQFVAEYHGHVDPDVFAGILWNVARWYNDACLIPEDNNHGATVLSRLKEVYHNLFIRKVHDAVRGEWFDAYGFRTTWKTKSVLIDGLHEYLRTCGVPVPLPLLHECETFVLDDKGRASAQGGAFDDRVMAAALAIRGDLDLPPVDEIRTPVSETARDSMWVWDEQRKLIAQIEQHNAENPSIIDGVRIDSDPPEWAASF